MVPQVGQDKGIPNRWEVGTAANSLLKAGKVESWKEEQDRGEHPPPGEDKGERQTRNSQAHCLLVDIKERRLQEADREVHCREEHWHRAGTESTEKDTTYALFTRRGHFLLIPSTQSRAMTLELELRLT